MEANTSKDSSRFHDFCLSQNKYLKFLSRRFLQHRWIQKQRKTWISFACILLKNFLKCKFHARSLNSSQHFFCCFDIKPRWTTWKRVEKEKDFEFKPWTFSPQWSLLNLFFVEQNRRTSETALFTKSLNKLIQGLFTCVCNSSWGGFFAVKTRQK